MTLEEFVNEAIKKDATMQSKVALGDINYGGVYEYLSEDGISVENGELIIDPGCQTPVDHWFE